MQMRVLNMAGEQVGEVELRDDIFAVPVNEAVMHQALMRQLANARQGTADTKTRGEVSGGGRKPWRQKGTGRARQGSIRAPHWRKGGTVFGPHPRSYEQRMPRKMRRLALRSALSLKAKADQIILLDKLEMGEPRTKEMIGMLNNLKVDSSALILLPEASRNVEKSADNLPGVMTLRATNLNVRDILGYDYLIMPLDSLRVIEGILGQ
ncbi:MAG: 50S ribosomal protein L4 [Chloroflexi bacterium]|nr:50S ribosomal protein L4 [Chloroflexota bacterium]